MPIIELDEGPGDFVVKVRTGDTMTAAVHLNIFEVSAHLVAGGGAPTEKPNGQAGAAQDAAYVKTVADAMRATAYVELPEWPKETSDHELSKEAQSLEDDKYSQACGEAMASLSDARLYAILDKCERRYRELGEERERRPRSPQPTGSSSGLPASPTKN